MNKQLLDFGTYNVLGLKNDTPASKVMSKTTEDFNDFIAAITTKVDTYRQQFISGGLTEDQLELELKNSIIIPVINKLKQLADYGRERSIYQRDYISIKRKLINVLLSLFGSAIDIPNLEYTTEELKKIEMIPGNFTSEAMMHYCSIGRWL